MPVTTSTQLPTVDPTEEPAHYLEREQPQEEFSEIELEWYAGAYGVTRPDAATRLRLETELGELNAYAGTAYPQSFGGMWIDNDGVVVHVGYTRDGQAIMNDLASRFSRPELLVPRRVQFTENELNELLYRVSDYRDQHWSGPPDDPRGFEAPYAAWVDVVGNRVVIEAPVGHSAAQAEAEEALRVLDHPALHYRRGPPTERFCSVTDCRWHFRGGVRLVQSADTSFGNRYCASGFQVRARGTSIPGTLTAGHCDGYPADTAWNGGVKQSRLRGRLFFENIDAQWMRYEIGASWQITRWIRLDTARQAWQIHHNTNQWSSTMVGHTVCVTGQYHSNSNTTCGRVHTRNASPTTVQNGRQFVELRRGGSADDNDLCAQPTDSGGPAWRGSTAIGLIQGGTAPELIPCWDSGYKVYVGHIQFVQERLLVDVECGPVTSTCIRR